MSLFEAARAARRAEIERALARYPHLSPDTLGELTRYFDVEASALDVGLIASNDAIAAPYARFRREHLDPLRAQDWLRGIAFATVIVGILIAVLWPAL